MAQEYLLTAEAHWIDSFEDPGGKRDVHDHRSRLLSERFEADNLDAARVKANELLSKFSENLPKKEGGSLSWRDRDADIVSVTFSMVLDL